MGSEEGTWGGRGGAALLLLLLLLLHCRPLATRWCRSPNLGQLRHTGGQQHALPGGGVSTAWGGSCPAWDPPITHRQVPYFVCLPPSSPSSGTMNWGWGLLPGTATPCSPPTSLWG